MLHVYCHKQNRKMPLFLTLFLTSIKLKGVCVCVCVCVFVCVWVCVTVFTLQLMTEMSEIELSCKSSFGKICK